MKNQLKRIARLLLGSEGSTAVEMAISCTVFFAMMIGIYQISYAFYIYQLTSDVARQASRWAMVRGNTSCTNTPNLSKCNAAASDVQTYARSLNYPGITSSSLSVTTTWCAASGSTPPISWATCSSSTSNAPGNLAKVYVTYPLSFNIPFSKSLSLNIGSSSQMVISQ